MSTSLPWPLGGAAGLRARLEAAYADPARRYHDSRHLAEVLERIEEILGADEPDVDRDLLVLAAWFHDAVHDGGPGEEERSARWAERALPDAGVSADRVAEVARLVRLTEQHRPAEGDGAGAVLSDADLGILAAGPGRYAEYAADVRAEYAAVPEEDFAAGRAALLEGLLSRPALFVTPHGRRHWERPARDNVAAEVASLRAACR